MAKFHVKKTFGLADRQLFVLAGNIVEGEVSVGMLVHIELNSAIATTAKIQAIEFARNADGTEDTCLCLDAKLDGIEFWTALNIADETLKVTETPGDELHDITEVVVRTFREHSELEDAEALKLIVAAGIEESTATQLVMLVPLAYGRVMLADTHAKFSNIYHCPGDDGKNERDGRLDSLPLWLHAIHFAQNDGQPFTAIASRSSEVKVANAALLDGKKLSNLIWSPPVFLWPIDSSNGSALEVRRTYGWSITHNGTPLEKVVLAVAMLVGLLIIGVVVYYTLPLFHTSP